MLQVEQKNKLFFLLAKRHTVSETENLYGINLFLLNFLTSSYSMNAIS